MFIDLHEELGFYCRQLGVECPELPPPIKSESEAELTQRQWLLQKYLCDLMVVLAERAPLPLLAFFGLPE